MKGGFLGFVILLITFVFSTAFYRIFWGVENVPVEMRGIVENPLIPGGWF